MLHTLGLYSQHCAWGLLPVVPRGQWCQVANLGLQNAEHILCSFKKVPVFLNPCIFNKFLDTHVLVTFSLVLFYISKVTKYLLNIFHLLTHSFPKWMIQPLEGTRTVGDHGREQVQLGLISVYLLKKHRFPEVVSSNILSEKRVADQRSFGQLCSLKD